MSKVKIRRRVLETGVMKQWRCVMIMGIAGEGREREGDQMSQNWGWGETRCSNIFVNIIITFNIFIYYFSLLVRFNKLNDPFLFKYIIFFIFI